jgi:subtilisin family serine protease
MPSSTSQRMRAFVRLSFPAVLVVAASFSAPALGAPAGVVHGAAAAAPPSVDAGDFYYFAGARVELRRSADGASVAFHPGTAREVALSALAELLPAVTVEVAGGTPGVRPSLVRLPEQGKHAVQGPATALSRVEEALSVLKASPLVAYAFPVFVNPATGTRMLPTDEIIARLRPGATAAALAERYGLTVDRIMWGTSDEVVFRLADPRTVDPLEVANAIAESGRVLWAEPNFVQEYRKLATPNDPLFGNQWHLQNTGQGGGISGEDVNAPGAWDLTTGSSSIVIAIIDDGVEPTHEDLAGSIFTNPGEIPGNGIDDDGNGYIDDVHGWDFSNGDNDPSPMSSDDNHGTAVAGVAAARGGNAIGVTGACQNCTILPVKIFSPGFAGQDAAANAIRYAASLADVLNNSWAGGSPSAAIQSAIQWAVTSGRGGKGTPVFFASGNSAGAFITFSVSGVPAGTHRFRWRYQKDGSVSSGEDTAWLAWAEFPGGERIDFEGGMPAGWTTGGNAPWAVVSNRDRADEGLCLLKSAKAGTITHGQVTDLEVLKTVPAGTLRYRAWVSSEYNSSCSWDFLKIWIDVDDDGTWWSGLPWCGVPAIYTDVSYPAAHPESIAVGAVTDFGCRSNYSQYGAALAVTAPSNGGISGITTTDRSGAAGYGGGNYTATFGGTSSATPLTAGVAALLLSRNPNLTELQVRQILQATADQVGPDPYPDGRNDRYGYGRIDAAAAIAAVPMPPTIDSFTPMSGPVGTAVTITGTSFTGATAVAFNGTGASFTVDSATAISTTVPVGATTGPISVTTPEGVAVSTGSFTVTLECDVVFADQTLTGAQSHSACGSITLGGALVVATGADVSFTAATRVIVRNGVSVASGAVLTLGVDSSLAP